MIGQGGYDGLAEVRRYLWQRAPLLGLLGISGLVLWWSFATRLPKVRQLQEESQLLVTRNRGAALLTVQQYEEESRRVQEGWQKARRELFETPQSLRGWMESVTEEALAMDLAVEFTPMDCVEATGALAGFVRFLPADMNLRLAPTAAPDKAFYPAMLKVLHRLLSGDKRIALDRLSVHGAGNGATEAQCQVTFWLESSPR